MSTILTFILAIPLGAPAIECDRLLAAGDFGHASPVCTQAGQASSLASLQRAARLARPPFDDPAWAVRARQATIAGVRAHGARPDGVVEAAFLADLMSLVRRTVEPDALPPPARWPVVGLNPPAPRLPSLGDEALDKNRAAVDRSAARLQMLRRRAAESSADMRPAVKSGEGELGRLWGSRLAALEDAFSKDPRLATSWWLALAEAYFVVDRTAKPGAPHARGRSVLEKIRTRFVDTPEARLSALWLAGFAIAEGRSQEATALLAAATGADPTLEAFYRAHSAWLARDFGAASALVAQIKNPGENVAIHIAALKAALESDPLSAAQQWASFAAGPVNSKAANMANHMSVFAWGDAAAGATAVERVPSALRLPASLYSIARGRLKLAASLTRLHGDDQQTDATLPDLMLRIVDAMRARGDDSGADDLLARLARRVLVPGPWATANAGIVPAVRAAIESRIVSRLQPLLVAGVRVDAATQRAVGPLVLVRTTLIPPPEAARIGLGQKLAVIGFGTEAAGLLRDLRDGTDRGQRLQAAQAEYEIARNRVADAAAKGIKVGGTLGGRPADGPMPEVVKGAVSAMTRLLPLLPPGDARDELEVTRAAVRIDFGQTDLIRSDLTQIADARLQSFLGLRAALLLINAETRTKAALSTRYSRARPGPPEWSAGLRETLKKAYQGRQGDQALTLVNQRLYARAAVLYADHARTTPGVGGEWARASAAVAWTLGLRPEEAVAAWRRLVADNGRLADEGSRHLAELLELLGDSPGAALAYEQWAARDTETGAGSLLRAIRLQTGHPEEQKRLTGVFLARFPNHTRAAAMRASEGRSAPTVAPGQRPVGPPPAPQSVCYDAACPAMAFWPN